MIITNFIYKNPDIRANSLILINNYVTMVNSADFAKRLGEILDFYGISAAALPALHRLVASGLPQHVADRAAVGAGESALSLRQLPHPGASLQPAPGGGGRGGLHRWPAGATPTPAGLPLDAVLGHGLLADAGQTLVLHGALPGPPASTPSR